MLVTDAMAAMGLCEGEHRLGHMAINVAARPRASCKETDTSVETPRNTDVQAGTPSGILVATVKDTNTLAGRYVYVYMFMPYCLC